MLHAQKIVAEFIFVEKYFALMYFAKKIVAEMLFDMKLVAEKYLLKSKSTLKVYLIVVLNKTGSC
jgi:hypothetical protein